MKLETTRLNRKLANWENSYSTGKTRNFTLNERFEAQTSAKKNWNNNNGKNNKNGKRVIWKLANNNKTLFSQYNNKDIC